MLASVLLHVGGLITVIIVSIVFSIFSSRKKEKKRASFLSQFMPKQEQEPDTIIDSGPEPFVPNSSEDGHSFAERSYNEIFCDDMSDEDDWIERKEPTAEKQNVAMSGEKPAASMEAKPSSAGNPKSPSAGNRKPMAAVDDNVPESEYSLKNLDDAKRAIVYSEILKPKF